MFSDNIFILKFSNIGERNIKIKNNILYFCHKYLLQNENDNIAKTLKSKIFTINDDKISLLTIRSTAAIGKLYKKPNQPVQSHESEKYFIQLAICKYAKLSATFNISLNPKKYI
jgi:hypothetical protein